MLELQLETKDQRIRKNWLIITILTGIGSIFINLGLILAFPSISKEGEIELLIKLIFLIRSVVGSSLWILIFWYCAYKRQGSRLLTFSAILSPFLVIRSIYTLQDDFLDLSSVIALMSEMGLYAWWYVFSLKLRRVNKKLRSQAKFNQEYAQSIQAIAKSPNLDSLNVKLIELSKKWPALSYMFEEAHELRKTELLGEKIESLSRE